MANVDECYLNEQTFEHLFVPYCEVLASYRFPLTKILVMPMTLSHSELGIHSFKFSFIAKKVLSGSWYIQVVFDMHRLLKLQTHFLMHSQLFLFKDHVTIVNMLNVIIVTSFTQVQVPKMEHFPMHNNTWSCMHACILE